MKESTSLDPKEVEQVMVEDVGGLVLPLQRARLNMVRAAISPTFLVPARKKAMIWFFLERWG